MLQIVSRSQIMRVPRHGRRKDASLRGLLVGALHEAIAVERVGQRFSDPLVAERWAVRKGDE
jgi:hypothetical protein